MVEEFCRQAASQGRFFHLRKFNVTLDCFCCRPIRTLVDSMEGNSDVRATVKVAWRRAGKIPTSPPPSKVSLPVGDLDPILGLYPKRHLDRFTCFCRAYGRHKQTDRQTDHATRSVTTSRIYTCGTAMRPIIITVSETKGPR